MSDLLVEVNSVSKKFCRSLKRSLWYGVQDIGGEITGRRHNCEIGMPRNSKDVQLRNDEFWAVKDVSFELRRGECMALVGNNGAGKTTLLRMINGLIRPETGEIRLKGRVGGVIALGAGFNPVLSGMENIYTNAAVLGLSKREIDRKVDEIIDFAEIGEFINSPVQGYSSGMQVRLGFAIASALEPDILILDEVLAVGDTRFQAKCMRRITQMFARCGVLFVSHQPHLVQMICNKALWLRKGHMIQQGSTSEVLKEYLSCEGRLDSLDETQEAIFSEHILKCSLSTKNNQIKPGESLECELNIRLATEVRLGKLIICLLDSGSRYVARATCDLSNEIIRGAEMHIRTILKDLRLANGEYRIKVILFSQSPSIQLVNMMSPTTLYSDSEIVSEARYQPDASYSLSWVT